MGLDKDQQQEYDLLMRKKAAAQAAAAQASPAQAAPAQPKAPSGFEMGFMDPVYGAAELVGLSTEERERQYQLARQAAGETGIDWGRMAGNVMNPINFVPGLGAARWVGPAMKGLSLGKQALASIPLGAGLSATSALTAPTGRPQEEFGTAKPQQVGEALVGGGIAGPVATVAPSAVGAVARGAGHIVDYFAPKSLGMWKNIPLDIDLSILGPEAKEAARLATEAKPILPGSPVTVAEAMKPSPYGGSMARRQEDVFRIAGEPAATGHRMFDQSIEAQVAAINARDAATDPLRKAAFEGANRAGNVEAGVHKAVIPALSAREQAEAEIAAIRNLYPAERPPKVGLPPEPIPDRLQTAVEKFAPRISPELPAAPGTVGQEKLAALTKGELTERFGKAMAKQQAAEQTITSEMAKLDAVLAKGFSPLETQPVLEKIASLLQKGAKDTNRTRVLERIRETVMKTAPDGRISAEQLDEISRVSIKETINDIFSSPDQQGSKKQLAAELRTISETIADEIERAGGTTYKEYLRKWSTATDAIEREAESKGVSVRLIRDPVTKEIETVTTKGQPEMYNPLQEVGSTEGAAHAIENISRTVPPQMSSTTMTARWIPNIRKRTLDPLIDAYAAKLYADAPAWGQAIGARASSREQQKALLDAVASYGRVAAPAIEGMTVPERKRKN